MVSGAMGPLADLFLAEWQMGDIHALEHATCWMSPFGLLYAVADHASSRDWRTGH